MIKIAIRTAQPEDHKHISEIYNSNPEFLLNHLGMERIDVDFIDQEVASMNRIGFQSSVIVNQDTSEIIGVLDFRPGDEAYLSLLMLLLQAQGKGIGRQVYSVFERQMVKSGCSSVRIDVVNDYPGNVVSFWKKLGFIEGETVVLNWGNKKSKAVVMRKRIVRY